MEHFEEEYGARFAYSLKDMPKPIEEKLVVSKPEPPQYNSGGLESMLRQANTDGERLEAIADNLENAQQLEF